MLTQRSPEFLLLFPADVCLNACILLNVMFQKCVFSCRRTALHMRYTTMRSLNQTLTGGKEDIPKVRPLVPRSPKESQATFFSFLKFWIASTCLFISLRIQNSCLNQNWRRIWMMRGLLYSHLCCSFCFGFAVPVLCWRTLRAYGPSVLKSWNLYSSFQQVQTTSSWT